MFVMIVKRIVTYGLMNNAVIAEVSLHDEFALTSSKRSPSLHFLDCRTANIQFFTDEILPNMASF